MSLTAVVKKVHRYCRASSYSEIFLKTVSVPFNLGRTLQDRNTEVTVSRRGTAVSFESKHLLVRYGCKIIGSVRKTLGEYSAHLQGCSLWQGSISELQRWRAKIKISRKIGKREVWTQRCTHQGITKTYTRKYSQVCFVSGWQRAQMKVQEHQVWLRLTCWVLPSSQKWCRKYKEPLISASSIVLSFW